MSKKPDDKKQEPASPEVTWPQALRDVVVHSMDRGHLIPTGLFILAGIYFVRVPGGDLASQMGRLAQWLKDGSLVGYALAGGFLVFGGMIFGFIRTVHRGEIKRISDERTYWQERALNRTLESSDDEVLKI